MTARCLWMREGYYSTSCKESLHSNTSTLFARFGLYDRDMRLTKEKCELLSDFCVDLSKGLFLSAVLGMAVDLNRSVFERSTICLFGAIMCGMLLIIALQYTDLAGKKEQL